MDSLSRMFADVKDPGYLEAAKPQLPAQGMRALNVKSDLPKGGKAMLLAEVPITLATGSDQAAPIFMMRSCSSRSRE